MLSFILYEIGAEPLDQRAILEPKNTMTWLSPYTYTGVKATLTLTGSFDIRRGYPRALRPIWHLPNQADHANQIPQIVG